MSLILKTYRQIIFLSILGLIFLSGCGYRFGHGEIPENYRTISVPYVSGDVDGSLTAAIIKEIETSSDLEYVNSRGSIILCIKLLELRDQNIGFRYDRDKRDRITDCVIPTETRVTAVVEVKVIEACSRKNILGPVILTSGVDFDHANYTSRNGVNVFSLGQLNDIYAAKEAVKTPLNRALARMIVEYVNESW